jgi:hypothetical protein
MKMTARNADRKLSEGSETRMYSGTFSIHTVYISREEISLINSQKKSPVTYI